MPVAHVLQEQQGHRYGGNAIKAVKLLHTEVPAHVNLSKITSVVMESEV